MRGGKQWTIFEEVDASTIYIRRTSLLGVCVNGSRANGLNGLLQSIDGEP